MISRCAAYLFLLLTTNAYAFNVPKGLSADDRREVVRTLGVNSADKLLSNPYPLGGFDGWELGYAVEVIDVRDLRGLGTSSVDSDETSWRYSRFTLGKGLYDDVDVFVSFIPPTGQVPVSDYGGTLRWSAYQAAFLPVNVSVLVHGDQLNFANRFTNRNLGAEVTLGINVDDVAVYFGGGVIQATGTFTGVDQGGTCGPDCTISDPTAINGKTRMVSSSVHAVRTLVGLSYHYENLFAAAEIDRVRTAVYSMKLGLRF